VAARPGHACGNFLSAPPVDRAWGYQQGPSSQIGEAIEPGYFSSGRKEHLSLRETRSPSLHAANAEMPIGGFVVGDML
jgi:hypothetical protein